MIYASSSHGNFNWPAINHSSVTLQKFLIRLFVSSKVSRIPDVFIVNFQQILDIVLVFPILSFDKETPFWKGYVNVNWVLSATDDVLES